MVFYCQRNCYEKQYTTKVSTCKPAKIDVNENGKKKKIDCYEVTFDDTVLFPEGGGQPDDRGTVDGIAVLRVIRKGGSAIHFLQGPVKEESTVTQKVDWSRRHDHMQQHSAQHLITAAADSKYNFPTISWNLGEFVSHIELKTTIISPEEIAEIENVVNENIRASTPVSIVEYDAADPKLKEVRTRGLPEDVVGPVRVVSIEGIDNNMCCGTHVSNLADLQMIKLLHTEKGKQGNTLLFYVAGNRVLRYLGDCAARERILNVVLHSNPSDHIRLIEKCQKELKISQRSCRDALKDLAVAEAEKFLMTEPLPETYFHHRQDANLEYLGAIVTAINNENILKVLTSGEDKGPATLLLHGPPDIVAAVGPKLCEILDGQGGGKTRFTAKVNRLSKRKEATQYVLDYLTTLKI